MIKGDNVCLNVLMSVHPKDLEIKISQLLLNNTPLLDQFYFLFFSLGRKGPQASKDFD